MTLQAWFPLNRNINNHGLVRSTPVNNGAVLEDDGKFGKSYSFNGSQYIDTGFAESFGTGDFTISVWMYLTQVAGKTYQCVVGNKAQAANSVGCAIYWNQNQKKFLWSTADGSSATEIWSVNTFDTIIYNTWHHIVMVRNSSDAKKGYFYIDGERQEIASVPAIRNVTSSTSIKIGAMPANAAYFFTGKLNDVRLYDYALSEQDIKELYWGKILEFSPQWRDATRIHDASGFIYPFTPKNLTFNGNAALFNGTSTEVDFDGINMSGGTVSIWFSVPSKPTAQKILYYDPVSKMVVGFLAAGNILLAANGVSQVSWQTTGITWGQLNNVIGVWNENRQPVTCYINGVVPATAANSNWTANGTVGAIGRRIASGGANDFLSGSVNEIKVYTQQLTADEAKFIYEKGPCPNNWGEDWRRKNYMVHSGCTYVRVLHHNAPASNLFTTANRKNIETENLYSKLGLFDDPNAFKSKDGKYQFMVREKLEASSTENVGIWTQTSCPTASTLAGYTQIWSSTGSWPRTFGLTHQDDRAVFDDSGSTTWWCSCGCSTAWSGGIPGFYGVVKTGYLDLYIRVDNTY